MYSDNKFATKMLPVLAGVLDFQRIFPSYIMFSFLHFLFNRTQINDNVLHSTVALMHAPEAK